MAWFDEKRTALHAWSALIASALLPLERWSCAGGVKRNRKAAMAALPFPGPEAESRASRRAHNAPGLHFEGIRQGA